MNEPKVSVGILFEPQIEFVLFNPFLVKGEEVRGKQIVSYSNDKILWEGILYDELLFEPVDKAETQFELLDVTIGINFHWERKEDQLFRGAFKVIVENGKLTGINLIDVEDYLTSVISSEMSATASLELLKAHAVISRSWLLASLTPTLSKGEGGGECSDNKKHYYQTANCASYDCLKENQKRQKENPTEAEKIIWKIVRNNQLGYKFRRQHIIGDYIADFVCLEKKLIIEIDGKYHNVPNQIAKDNERTEKLNQLGFNVIRFTNDEIIHHIDKIEQTIIEVLANPLKENTKPNVTPPFPLSYGEGRGEAVIRWYDREAHTNFDVCADDHCQRYQGITRASTDIVCQAIEATRGQVITFDGKICDARFSKCCGGVFEEFQNCWEDIKHPYLVKQRDSKNTSEIPDLQVEKEAEKWIRTSPEAFCNTTDKKILSQVLNNYDQETTNFYRWKVEYTQEDLSQLIKEKSGIDFGDILDLVPIQRGTSGRLVKLKIIGSKHTLIIGKELEIRRTLSSSHLYSSAFVVDKEDVNNGIPGKFILTGAGWGHGVGLCQIGAAVMGEEGYTYDSILLHYYIGASIEKLYN